MIQIITFLNILVIERHVLKGIDKPTLLSDVHNLFKKLALDHSITSHNFT